MQDPITFSRGDLIIAKGAHHRLVDKQRNTMRHALVIAAGRYDDYAAQFDAAHEADPSRNWDKVAEQHRQNAKDTRDLIDMMDSDEEDEEGSPSAVIFVRNAEPY
ncbi:hypothetical protein KIKIMORA_04890 [Brevundimonas phage vB_BpoS-Kikimora]|uniref:Uncharacterized protein n=1 Tax=Brevundimonas phage vB_BpoS-Kikimora TaxID=2948601 RepID=A0A9E7MTR3_9CAUD|nr:hypothetical protein KIKIMORA_04890 [Brevundimonas phage vB_BpoS-Kikimora]